LHDIYVVLVYEIYT